MLRLPRKLKKEYKKLLKISHQRELKITWTTVPLPDLDRNSKKDYYQELRQKAVDGNFVIITAKQQNRAYEALLAYEKNCIEKYDRPHGPSMTPPKGERMEDYAIMYNTTVKEMKNHWRAVEKELGQ